MSPQNGFDSLGSLSFSHSQLTSEDPPAFVMHTGDLAYAEGSTEKWDSWMDIIEPYARLAPYMVGVGNHEYGYTCPCTDNPDNAADAKACASKDPSHPDTPGGYRPLGAMYGNDSRGECGVPFFTKFKMPHGASAPRAGEDGNAPQSVPPFYYAFSYASAHFITLSSEHSLEQGSRQLAWLEHHMQEIDRDITPWVFVSIHRPLYSTMIVPPQWAIEVTLRKTLEPLLAAHKVAVLFAGHEHTYERTCSLRSGECVGDNEVGLSDGDGTVHIIVGTGGAHLHNWYRWPFGGRLLNYLDDYGYGRLHVVNSTVSKFEFIRNSDGGVFDSVTIMNPFRTAAGERK